MMWIIARLGNWDVNLNFLLLFRSLSQSQAVEEEIKKISRTFTYHFQSMIIANVAICRTQRRLVWSNKSIRWQHQHLPDYNPLKKQEGWPYKRARLLYVLNTIRLRIKQTFWFPVLPHSEAGVGFCFPPTLNFALPPSLLSVYTMKTSTLLDTFTARATDPPTDQQTRRSLRKSIIGG